MLEGILRSSSIELAAAIVREKLLTLLRARVKLFLSSWHGAYMMLLRVIDLKIASNVAAKGSTYADISTSLTVMTYDARC